MHVVNRAARCKERTHFVHGPTASTHDKESETIRRVLVLGTCGLAGARRPWCPIRISHGRFIVIKRAREVEEGVFMYRKDWTV